MSDDQSEEHGLELVMPFVTVTSGGGPHDDNAYVAGWEMGALDAELQHARPPIVERVIHTENGPQADLLAMKHGYHLNLYEMSGGWSSMKLTRMEVESA